MARDIQQSLSDLGHDIASFRQSTSQFNRAAGSIAMLFRSRAFKSAAKTVEIQQKFDAAVRLRDRAKDIIEAKNAMAAQPNRWKSTSDYLKERDKLKAARERVSERKKDKASAFTEWHNRQYGNTPNALRDRVRQFGGQGGRVAFEQDFKDAYNSEFDPKTYQYEQDVRAWGRGKADILRNERERREERKGVIRSNKKLFARRKEYRRNIYENAPWMKSLIQSGKLDKKYLPLISKGIDKLRNMPGGGAILRASKNPYIAAVTGTITAIRAITALRVSSKEAGSELQSISDMSTFGRNGKYSLMATGLGMSEKQALQSWQRLQGKYGPATEQVLMAFGRAAKGKSAAQVQQMAQDMGFSQDDANIALMLTGGKEITKNHGYNLAKVAKDRQRLQRQKQGVWGVIVDWTAEKLGANDAAAVDAADAMTRRLRDKVETTEAEASSQSTSDYSSGSTSNDNRVTNIDPEINITINGNADPKAVASAVEDGMNRAISRQEVLDTVSRGVVA